MLLPRLDERLQAAYELFPCCRRGADIGTDHGRLPLHLLASGRVEEMILSDISSLALARGRALLERWGLADRAVFRAADGLDCLREPVEAVSILGMGGETIADILAKGFARLEGAELVLSAHTELEKVRQAVAGIGYHLSGEALCRAGGRLYVVMQARLGACAYTEQELWLGPCLMAQRPPLWGEYLAWRLKVTRRALDALGPGDPRGASLQRLRGYLETAISRE